MSFRNRYLLACGDCRPRTVAQIREELDLPETANVSEALTALQANLAADRAAGMRVRWAKLPGGTERVWWVEPREINNR